MSVLERGVDEMGKWSIRREAWLRGIEDYFLEIQLCMINECDEEKECGCWLQRGVVSGHARSD